MQQPLNLEYARSALAACKIGHTIESYSSVESTMLIAQSALRERAAAASGLVIIAEEQRQGRGRLERKWETPFGKALLVSMVLGQELLPSPITHLPILTSVAVRRAIISTVQSSTNQPEKENRVLFKWPNDILAGADASKIAGLLTELSFVASKAEHAILGIGINVNQESHEFPPVPRGSQQPTSLMALSGIAVDRTRLLVALCLALSDALEECSNGSTRVANSEPTEPPIDKAKQTEGAEAQWEEWRSHLHTIGQLVTVSQVTQRASQPTSDLERDAQAPFTGKAIDVTKDGYLVVQGAQGERREFSSGEVTLRSNLT